MIYLLSDERVIEREFGNLEKIKDHHEKVVLSMDEISMGNKNGIQHKNIIDFLLRS